MASAGASLTFPKRAGELSVGDVVMMKQGRAPCRITRIAKVKPSKHGHAKAVWTAVDIFTGCKVEDTCPTSHTVDCPFVTVTNFVVGSIDEETGELFLIGDENPAEQRHDLSLAPQGGAAGLSDALRKVHVAIMQDFAKEKTVTVTVTAAAAGQELREEVTGFRSIVED